MFRVIKAFRVSVLSLIVTGAVLLVSRDRADAQAKYRSVFKKKYKQFGSQFSKAKCSVCHDKKTEKKKKPLNDYGKAMAKSLGKKKVKGTKAIEAALTKTEAAKNTKGITFGSLIKAGKLPGTPAKK